MFLGSEDISREIDVEAPPEGVPSFSAKELFGEERWKEIRRKVHSSSGLVCAFCSCSPEDTPVYADMVWEYTDTKIEEGYYVMKLSEVVTVCPECYKLRHLFGDEGPLLKSFSEKWNVTIEEALKKIKTIFQDVGKKSGRAWVLDLSWLSDHGFNPDVRDPLMRVLVDGEIRGEK